MTESVTHALKSLRERAGFTIRELAAALEQPVSTYSSYERATYKKRYLPVELTEKLIPVLTGLGSPPITREDVLALSGLKAATTTPAAPPTAPQMTISQRDLLRALGSRLRWVRILRIGDSDPAIFAKTLGCSAEQLKAYESGGVQFPLWMLIEAILRLNVPSDFILFGETDRLSKYDQAQWNLTQAQKSTKKSPARKG